MDVTYSPWRHRYTILGVVLCLLLIGWGGWVTSIDAGLAVPDWPTSFDSMDPIATGFHDPNNPDARWWMYTPILAEHSHRLLGALVGLWTIGLLVWSLVRDRRRTVKFLATACVALVIMQGVLGGLRVIWVSLDLAVMHALGAQLFFSSLMAMVVVNSRGWISGPPYADAPKALRNLGIITAGAILIQILLGALLRHPGEGVDLWFTLTHVMGSFIVTGLIVVLASRLRNENVLVRWSWMLLGGLGLQMSLGVLALLVLLYEENIGVRSTLQIGLNSSHLIVGTLLLGFTVAVALHLSRRSD